MRTGPCSFQRFQGFAVLFANTIRHHCAEKKAGMANKDKIQITTLVLGWEIKIYYNTETTKTTKAFYNLLNCMKFSLFSVETFVL